VGGKVRTAVIGVRADVHDLEIAREFFELFKTPWEPAVAGRRYNAVLSNEGSADGVDAGVHLAYGVAAQTCDRQARMLIEQVAGTVDIGWGEQRLPVYRGLVTFQTGGGTSAVMGSILFAGKALDYRESSPQGTVWRVGYDLFQEVRFLLTCGQPARNAHIPTLELHIALLRKLLLDSGVAFVEVPPRPLAFAFACCLTHDLDFFGIRRHLFDRTMAGFIVRSTLGTLVEGFRGRRPLTDVIRNLLAVLSLPLVLLRVLPDFWHPIRDYLRADRGRPSTFFVIPFKGRPGVGPDDTVSPARSVAYEARDVRDELDRVVAKCCEIALHGIDAWRDAEAGRAELVQVAETSGQTRAGVRMHWLYFSDASPQLLERAGFEYDSSWGYNDAVGYRAGTSQVFCFPGTRSLLELPLTIMDTALFYRGRMNLARQEALAQCFGLVSLARRFGGTLVVNWHDRSLAPERLWGASYVALQDEIERDGNPWFATAADVVDWFRWRRSITFCAGPRGALTIAASPPREGLPGARACIHVPGNPFPTEAPFHGVGPLRLQF
jgi:hypothetical protein